MTRKISDNIINTSKKKTWECKCGNSGLVNEGTQALLCGHCGKMVTEFTLAEILTEPETIPEGKIIID